MRKLSWLGVIALGCALAPASFAQFKTHIDVDADCDGFGITISAENLPPNLLFEGVITMLVDPGNGNPEEMFSCDYPVAVLSDENGIVQPQSFDYEWCQTPYGFYYVDGFVTSGDQALFFSDQNTIDCPTCGNGTVDPGEACDDGNLIDDDGCSNACELPVAVCEGRIGNFVWNDGVQGATGECDGVQPAVPSMGINGVEVSLYDEAGDLLATTYTGETMVDGQLVAGHYQFNDLCAGSYEVRVSGPDGLIPAPLGAADPESDSNGSPALVVLTADDASDQSIDFGFCSEQMGGDQGCTPGYWKNQSRAWNDTELSRDDLVVDVFVNAGAWSDFSDLTLRRAMRSGRYCDDPLQRAARKLLRAGTAALLNAQHPEVDYGMSATAVIDAVDAALASNDRHAMLALKDTLDVLNNAGCPLDADGHCPRDGGWSHGGHHDDNRGNHGRRGHGRRGHGRR